MCKFSKGIVVASDNGYFGLYLRNEDPSTLAQGEEDYRLIYLRGWSSDR